MVVRMVSVVFKFKCFIGYGKRRSLWCFFSANKNNPSNFDVVCGTVSGPQEAADSVSAAFRRWLCPTRAESSFKGFAGLQKAEAFGSWSPGL